MSWQDRLVRAKWRGMEFLTESHDAREGQRLAVHELPGSDTPLVEDLGAKSRTWHVSAYFIGSDYDQARDAFLALLRTPGAEWLTHPWLGRVWARARDWSIAESNTDGGMARISVEFIDGGGDAVEPVQDVSDATDSALDDLVDDSSDWQLPDALSASGVQAVLAQVSAGLDRVRNALSKARLPLTMTYAVLDAVDNAKALVAEGLSISGQYATALRAVSSTLKTLLGQHDASSFTVSSATSSTAAVGTTGAMTGEAIRLRVVAQLVRESVAATPSAVAGPVSAAVAQALTQEAQTRQLWLAATAMQTALTDYTTADARDAAMTAVLTAVDAAMPQASDAVFQSAASARMLLQRSLQLQMVEPTQERLIVSPLPSAVLAYRMGVDESTLLARNGVRHPLFVQGAVRV